MKHIELLKKIAFLADRLEKYSDIDFSNIEIKINKFLKNSELLSYSLKVLSIPFREYTPDYVVSSPEELNFSVDYKTDLRALFVLAYVAKEVYSDDEIKIYIDYSIEAEGDEKEFFFGTYITEGKNFTNISDSIPLSQFISLNIDEMNWEKFSKMFPNKNYSDNGKCTYTEYTHIPNRKEYNYYENESYGEYAGSYAQDVEGLSDDFINDALDGCSDAYWNID